jgi:hypothetical protein
MFTAYIDDSGTAPEQKVAMATALVIPARHIIRFESEWNTFIEKWEIKDFHSSECAVANSKSDYAEWDKPKVNKAFKRVRQIIKKYGIKAYSLCVHKSSYEALVPVEERPLFGHYHYTYAVHNLLSLLDNWACRTGTEYPLEFVFDWEEENSPQRLEIENSLARSEKVRPGRFAGHYSFRKRKITPGLQCVDLIGWTCYRHGLNTFSKTPLTELQSECLLDFSTYKNGDWLASVGQTPRQIQKAVLSIRHYDGTSPLHVRANIL